MAGPEGVFNIRIVFRALILVTDQHGECGAGGFAFEDPRKNLYFILFLALSGNFTLTWTAPV